jgi:hypothetical protein
MKKTILIVALVVLALGVLGVGAAFAQGGRGYGPMHDYVEQALAAKLGLTEKQVEDLLGSGKPMYRIALDNGILQEELSDFMNEVHKDAFATAAKDGIMTQVQADWMFQRMQNLYQNGYGAGNCPMHNGQGGSGFGPGMMQNRGGYGPGMMWRQGAQNP